MPLKRGVGASSHETTAVSVSVAVGLGVAAMAGIAAGAAIGTGVLAVGAATSRRGVKPALDTNDIQWDEEGRIENWDQVIKIVQQGGVSAHLRPEMWPFLLGVYLPGSTTTQRAAELARLRSLYTKLVLVCQELDVQVEESKRSTEDATAGAPSGNLAAFAEAHRIIVMDAVRTDMRSQPSDFASSSSSASSSHGGFWGAAGGGGSHGGSSASRMPTVTVVPVSVGDGLPELMLVDPPQPDPVDAVANGELPVWRSALAVSTVDMATHMAPPARRLMMRLVNVLSAYAVHDPESGYCQGMSDLASAFVQLIEDDALAFACFERLMRGARQNFRHDEAGIKQQLLRVSRLLADTDPKLHAKLDSLGAADCTFAYRMVLVMLRRELPMDQAFTLWEIKWASDAEIAAAAQQRAALHGETGSGALSPATSSGGFSATVASMDAAARAAVAAAASGNGGLAGSNTTSGNGNCNNATSEKVSRPLSRSGSGSSTPKAGASGARRAAPGGLSGLSISSSSSTVAAQPPPPDFVLQFVVAVVRSFRGKVLAECHETDDVLRLFNGVRIDFWPTLAQARKQHKAYTQGIAVLKRLG